MKNFFTFLFLAATLIIFSSSSSLGIGDISIVEDEVKIKIRPSIKGEDGRFQLETLEQEVKSITKTINNDSVLYYKIHLREIEQRKQINLEIPFINNGNEPIVIPYCKPNWGGMSPKMEKKFLLPGEESLLTLTFYSRDLIGGSTKYATLSVNNANFKKVIIEMKWVFVREKTSIEFDYKTNDAGKVKEGVVEYEFPFTNTGDVPLIIVNCKSSCGCVVPYWPKDPTLPGEKGVIKAKFLTKARRGKQSKTLTLTANTNPEVTVLRLKAFVEKE